ncbi:MAG: hypothetical protein RLN62_06945 [Rickettsiales bacterium]
MTSTIELNLQNAIADNFNGFRVQRNMNAEEQKKVLVMFVNSNTCIDPLLASKSIFNHIDTNMVDALANEFAKTNNAYSLGILLQSNTYLTHLKTSTQSLSDLLEYSLEKSSTDVITKLVDNFAHEFTENPDQLIDTLKKKHTYSDQDIAIITSDSRVKGAIARYFKEKSDDTVLMQIFKQGGKELTSVINEVSPEKVNTFINNFGKSTKQLKSAFRSDNPNYINFLTSHDKTMEVLKNFAVTFVENINSGKEKIGQGVSLSRQANTATAKFLVEQNSEEAIDEFVNKISNYLSSKNLDDLTSFITSISSDLFTLFAKSSSFSALTDKLTEDHYQQIFEDMIINGQPADKVSAVISDSNYSSHVSSDDLVNLLVLSSKTMNNEPVMTELLNISNDSKVNLKSQTLLRKLFISLLEKGEDVLAENVFQKFSDDFTAMKDSVIEELESSYDANCAAWGIESMRSFLQKDEMVNLEEEDLVYTTLEKQVEHMDSICTGSTTRMSSSLTPSSNYDTTEGGYSCTDVMIPKAVMTFQQSTSDYSASNTPKVETITEATTNAPSWPGHSVVAVTSAVTALFTWNFVSYMSSGTAGVYRSLAASKGTSQATINKNIESNEIPQYAQKAYDAEFPTKLMSMIAFGAITAAAYFAQDAINNLFATAQEEEDTKTSGDTNEHQDSEL